MMLKFTETHIEREFYDRKIKPDKKSRVCLTVDLPHVTIGSHLQRNAFNLLNLKEFWAIAKQQLPHFLLACERCM